MAQKFLSIKDFEKYQHYKHRTPPWIKLYNSLLDDYAFSKLPTGAKYLYLGLLILCSRHANRVPNDCTWIAHALHMDPKEIDLTPLYRSGLLLASRNHIASVLHENALSETEKSRDRVETETEARPRKLSDDEFLQSLRDSPAYKHIDLNEQLGKMDIWLKLHPGRQRTRKFIVNWLNKIDKPVVVPIKQPAVVRIVDREPAGEAVPCPPEVAEKLRGLVGKIGNL